MIAPRWLGLGRALWLGLAFALATPALGVEFQIEGSYRARFRAFDTLSLTRSQSASEHGSIYFQHRLILKPAVIVSDHVGLFVEIKGLDNVVWGTDVHPIWNPSEVGFSGYSPFADDLVAPSSNVSTNDATAMLTDFTLWRAYAQINARFGRFKFGRMPLHWGAGMWQNDGHGVQADYGDTTDRIQFETSIKQVYLQAALDINVQELVATDDDTFSVNFVGAYRTERINAGANLQLRFSPSNNLTLVTADIAGDMKLGPLTVVGEFAAQFGSGDLEGDNQSIRAFGGIIDAELAFRQFRFGLHGGFATGDKDPTDGNQRTYTFDRDYNLGILLFEQPMPVLADQSTTTSDSGRNYTNTLSGNAVSNALYIKPKIGFAPHQTLLAEFSYLGARTAVNPDPDAGRSTYGNELTLALHYAPFKHFTLSTHGAVFFPGSYYKNYASAEGITPAIASETFTSTVWGGQITARVAF